jgi:starch phosphorylase
VDSSARPKKPRKKTAGESRKPAGLKTDILSHIQNRLGIDPLMADKYSCFMGLAYTVRDRLIAQWMKSQRALYDTLTKRVYFLSLEFLPGRFLMNYLTSMDMVEEAGEAVREIGFDLEDLEEQEWDAGLGNGGLGRLASCYMDSFACRKLPGYGYGIRYDYGMFHQVFEDGYQKELCDNWVRYGTPWEIQRSERQVPIRFYGRTESYRDRDGNSYFRWVGGEVVMAMACDILVPGYGVEYVTNMRLWAAQSSHEFDLQEFNEGDYVGAVESKVFSENISKVLYPSDEVEPGKELRLKQQYFFVAATLHDILRRHRKVSRSFEELPEFVAIQLNDTHPAVAIPELMRLLMDEEELGWDDAWEICEKTFAYTNHTVLPEALENWPVELFGRLLPRHLEIIYEINYRFLEKIRHDFPDDPDLIARVSLIQEGTPRLIRMANLAIVGSHTVNGVAALHSEILKNVLFKDFHRIFPERIRNITNGVTPRRWLNQANPGLSALITKAIGPEWIKDLSLLERLAPYAGDAAFRADWMRTRQENKKRLARYILRKIETGVNPESMFDVQIKRIHEYKRQLLNALHVITLYNRIKSGAENDAAPRTVIFAGKAATAYHQAKRIIKLIHSIADVVNRDPEMRDRLRVIFLPNYCVSQAEKIIPAADLSEQISTAGMEASGTGNMKMAMNGALTVGTMDGANVEILEAVGRDNMFIFGLSAEEVAALRRSGYDPGKYYREDPELRQVVDMIALGYFSPMDRGLFAPIVRALLNEGDYFMLMADYRSYVDAQEEVSRLFRNRDEWARRSILNTANMGRFSSDRAVLQYAGDIWNVHPIG